MKGQSDDKSKLPATTVNASQRAVEVAQDIATLSYRQAAKKYEIGYRTWRAIKSGDQRAYLPRQAGDRVAPEAIDAILASVKTMPQLNTIARAQALGFRVERVQRVLAAARLSRLSARLQFAGYTLAPSPALAAARQRRILAASPGCYVACDFKYFGLLRGVGKSPSVRICGLVAVDQFTGYGDVLLCPTETADMAAAGISRFCKRAPFPIKGLCLTDNGSAFTSDAFLSACQKQGLINRTTRYHHPWSNGKVERFNRTLATECFPAILTGLVPDIFSLQDLVDVWLKHYNGKRCHTGWMNRGLPPLAIYSQWKDAKGDHPLERLVAMGILKQADTEWIRPLGAKDLGSPGKDRGRGGVYSETGVPYAYVVDRGAQQAAAELKEQAMLAAEACRTLTQVTNMQLAMKKGGKSPLHALTRKPLVQRRPVGKGDE